MDYTIIPGACAFVNAFCLSGFPAPFTFVGFLPDNKKDKKNLLLSLKNSNFTSIFYSAPHNLFSDLNDLYSNLGNRQVCIVRELTKLYEEVYFMNLADKYPKEPRGEYVIIVKGQADVQSDLNSLSLLEHYEYYLNLGISNNEAIKLVAKDLGQPKSEVYNQIVKLKSPNDKKISK